MVRKFVPFNREVIFKELKDLPTDAFLSLTHAMENYAGDTGVHYQIDNYGDGLMMIKGGQGRCLFFFAEKREQADGSEIEILTSVLVYKKESQKAPDHILSKARERMRTAKETK